ncbi:class I SAM-dependent methyltransferase [Allopusillimonas ginsengisoli]|uniref:class I SAM-dependent methyltransferase n=1 Tax=Allopusillimonas ginsengisoli TaxID=453575 RepID=UPI001020E697|nr:class I SAM-dependent methyltransferase [Allopusillimonas ginsengisoli]TEA69606.1 methyltransferase domain-containing protein [Allopusillimonas ginsengisoli]
MENKMPGRAAQELESLVSRVREEALRLVDQAAEASGDVKEIVQSGHRQATGLASDNDYLSLLRLFSFNSGEVVDGLYHILLGREADAQGKRDYERMLGLTGSRLRLALDLRHSAEGRRKAVPVEGRWLGLVVYGTQTVLERLRLGRLGRRLTRSYETWLSVRWSWQGSLVREHIRQTNRLRQVASELTVLKKTVVAMAKETPDSGDELARELDAYYIAFEEDGRGAPEQVKAKLKVYEDWLVQLSGSTTLPVLDVGCGRGEWLELLEEHGLQAWGVDASPSMVQACRGRHLQVTCGDAQDVIATIADQALGAVTLFHIVEHLPFPALFTLIREVARVLEPGGSILIETPNPENVLVGSHTFYHDFTHRNPVTPSALQFLLAYHGFERLDVRRLNPYPPEARVPGTDPLTERVNGHLCGPQDYAVIGWRPASAAERS